MLTAPVFKMSSGKIWGRAPKPGGSQLLLAGHRSLQAGVKPTLPKNERFWIFLEQARYSYGAL